MKYNIQFICFNILGAPVFCVYFPKLEVQTRFWDSNLDFLIERFRRTQLNKEFIKNKRIFVIIKNDYDLYHWLLCHRWFRISCLIVVVMILFGYMLIYEIIEFYHFRCLEQIRRKNCPTVWSSQQILAEPKLLQSKLLRSVFLIFLVVNLVFPF